MLMCFEGLVSRGLALKSCVSVSLSFSSVVFIGVFFTVIHFDQCLSFSFFVLYFELHFFSSLSSSQSCSSCDSDVCFQCYGCVGATCYINSKC